MAGLIKENTVYGLTTVTLQIVYFLFLDPVSNLPEKKYSISEAACDQVFQLL